MYCYGTTFMELPSGNCHTISGTYLIIVIELLYTVHNTVWTALPVNLQIESQTPDSEENPTCGGK